MKARYQFLLRFLGVSLLLFIFGHQLLHGYVSLMAKGMKMLNPGYLLIPVRAEEFLYGSSMVIIAFIALMVATPGMVIGKKAGIITIGLIAFFLTDWLFIQYVIFPKGQPALNEDSAAYEMYLCVKWLLPFLLWIMVSRPHLGGLLRSGKEVNY